MLNKDYCAKWVVSFCIINTSLNPFKRQSHKMVKHTQKPTNPLSVFDHFVGLLVKRLINGSQFS